MRQNADEEIINIIIYNTIGKCSVDSYSDIIPEHTLQYLNADSLDVMEIIILIEGEFNIAIDDESMVEWTDKPLSEVYEFVERLVSG